MIAREYFMNCVGRAPEGDDLERCNCEHAGNAGHFLCGWCERHEAPRYLCGCLALKDRILMLRGSGVFSSDRFIGYSEEIQLRVEESGDAIIPNVWIVPSSRDRNITVLFGSDVPDELVKCIVEKANIIELLHAVMSDQVCHEVLNRIFHVMHAFADRCFLWRDVFTQKWAYDIEAIDKMTN